ncbi:MAG: FAD-binding oxidoreductase [Isosphaeraceae bacterium]
MTENGKATWPEPPAAGPLGDGRHARERLRPATVAELRDMVREQVSRGSAIYPQGGATALDYGGPPGRPGVAIDTTAMAGVIDYPHADMTITVQAGITASALRAILAEKHQRLQLDIPQADRATLGGVYATATCGPRRFGLGRPRDQIVGVSFVTTEGVEVKGGGRVVKNVAGYDFPRLLTGSMGTLGIITQMTLIVRPLPEASALCWAPFAALDPIASALDALNTSAARPVAIDLLSPLAAKSMGEPLGLSTEGWVVVIGLEDSAASVRWQTNRLLIELGRTDLKVLEDDATSPLWSALTEFQAAESGPISCVANLPPSRVVPFLQNVDAARWSVQAHAGNGIVRLQGLGEWNLDEAAAEIDRLRGQAVRDGGNLILSRCPTGWKDRLRVWGEPRADWALARRIKQTLDPLGAFNPGRFVGGI